MSRVSKNGTSTRCRMRAGRRRQHVDRVGQVDRLGHVVRHEQDRVVLGPRHVEQQSLHLPARVRIERAERLVHQDDARLVDERASDRHALLHPAGEVLREVVRELVEADRLQVADRALAALRLRHALPLEAVFHVVAHRQPAERRVGLEHHAAVPAHRRDRLPLEQNLAGRRPEQPRDRLQDGGLPAPGRPEEHDDLAVAGLVEDLERHVAHRLGAAPVPADVGDAEVLDLEFRDRLAHAAFSRHRNSTAEQARMSASVSRPMPPMTSRPANDHDAFWWVRASSTM